MKMAGVVSRPQRIGEGTSHKVTQLGFIERREITAPARSESVRLGGVRSFDLGGARAAKLLPMRCCGCGEVLFGGEERGERGGCFISPQKDPGIVAPGVSLKQDYGTHTQSTICCVDACENAGGGVEPLARSPVWDVPLRASRRRKV